MPNNVERSGSLYAVSAALKNDTRVGLLTSFSVVLRMGESKGQFKLGGAYDDRS